MKKIMLVVICGIWIGFSIGCSKKNGPNPEDTVLIKSGGRNTFIDGDGIAGASGEGAGAGVVGGGDTDTDTDEGEDEAEAALPAAPAAVVVELTPENPITFVGECVVTVLQGFVDINGYTAGKTSKPLVVPSSAGKQTRPYPRQLRCSLPCVARLFIAVHAMLIGARVSCL